MSPTSTDRITLTGSQRRELTRMTRAGRTEQRLVTRAQIVLAAAAGESNAQIARWLRICEDTVRKWRRRWCVAPGAASLADAKRSGRPPVFSPVQVARVKAMACTPPKDCGLPLSRWSCPELAQQIIADGICESISPATVRRWLSQDALKPWQYQSWIFISDPDFAAKAQRVLDLYARVWDGEPLGRNDYVISADEKTSIQARCRCHPTLPAGKARMIRVNHDYHRRGAVAYLAAYDVHHAKGLRPLREHHRHRRVHQPGHPGHDPGALQVRRPGVLDRGQRLLPPRTGRDRPTRRAIPQRDHGAHPGARVLAEPDPC
jgi:transposase